MVDLDSSKIIKSINQIYDELNIIPHLRMHMFRAAAIGEIIAENWSTKSFAIHKDDIIAALLLHDIGNIAKFNFDEPLFWHGHDSEYIEYWKGIKRETIEKYGTQSDYAITAKMAEGLGISERAIFLISNMGFTKIDSMMQSDDFDLKICTYADQRVGPLSVVSISERLEDLRRRYGKENGWKDESGLRLERQIFENVSITPLTITESAVQKYIHRYMDQKSGSAGKITGLR